MSKHVGFIGRTGALALLLTLGNAAAAADACSSYKWDVSREVKLFGTTAEAIAASADAATAPAIVPDRFYALTLKPQEAVRYAIPASKKMLPDGAFGGLLKLRVDKGGPHRIAIDAGFWLDVAHDGKGLATLDFNGSSACPGPRKIVVFDLPAGTDLTVQLSGATSASARLTVTPVAAPPR